MRSTLYLIILMASPFVHAQPVFEWVRHGGGTNVDAGYSVDVDASRCVYVAGEFSGSASFDGATLASASPDSLSAQNFLAKYSPEGRLLWIQPIGVTRRVGPNALFQLKLDRRGFLYLAGSIQDTVLIGDTMLVSPTRNLAVARFDTSGRLVWAKRFAGSYPAYGLRLAVDHAGNALFTGYFSTRLVMGATTLHARGQDDMFLAKITNTGACQWALRDGGAYTDDGWGVATDADDNVYVCGDYGSYGHEAIFGTDTLRPVGGRDVFLVKYSPGGKYLWSRSAGGDWNSFFGWGDIAYAVACDDRNNVYIAGHTGAMATFGDTTITAPGTHMVGFVARYGTDGSFHWVRQFGGGDGLDVQDATVDRQGNVFLTGYFYGEAPFGNLSIRSASGTSRALYLAKMDAAGTFRWVLDIAGRNDFNNYSNAITASPDGDIFITGGCGGDSVRFGPFTVNPRWSDMFLARIRDEKPDGIEDVPDNGSPVSSLVLFPQPVRRVVAIRAPARIDRYRVVDVFGRVLALGSGGNATTASIDLGGIPDGLCFVQVADASGHWISARFLKLGR
jgi:hypothetical protein